MLYLAYHELLLEKPGIVFSSTLLSSYWLLLTCGLHQHKSGDQRMCEVAHEPFSFPLSQAWACIDGNQVAP